IVSSDSVPPYERPPLSKGFLAGKDDEASVFINPEQWYREHGIEVRLGTVVERVDARRKLLRTRDGVEISFEKLLVATGAWSRVFTAEMSAFFEAYYERHGVMFRKQETIAQFDGDGRLAGAVTASGARIPAQAAVLGIGVVPAVEALDGSGLTIDNGVVVNE